MDKNFTFVFILLCFLTGSFILFVQNGEILPSSFAEKFEHVYSDGHKYTLEYQLINGTLTNFGSLFDYQSMIFDVNGTDAQLILNIPKTIPFDYTENEFEPFFVALNNGQKVKLTIYEKTCEYSVSINFDGSSQIELTVPNILAGTRITYMELPQSCLDDPKYNNEIQQKIKTKQCKNLDHERGFNIRNEVVCISPDSYSWLIQRGYMKTFPIIHN